MIFIWCSLRSFVIIFKTISMKYDITFLCKHILIFYHRNHIVYGLDCFADNSWSHHVELLLVSSLLCWIFHAIDINYFQKPRILNSNIWHKHKKPSPSLFQVKLNAIISNILIHSIYPFQIFFFSQYFTSDGSGISSIFFHFVNRVLMYQLRGQVGNLRLELQHYCHSIWQ